MFPDSFFFTFILLPLLIFCARIFDQSLGILRILFATKGLKYLALIAGFVESLVWLMAISQIMKHLDNVFCYLAFSSGFAAGNFVGIYIENKLSIGSLIVRVVLRQDWDQSIIQMKEQGYRISVIDVQGMRGPAKMVFTTIKRSELNCFIHFLNENNPDAFYTVEDARLVKEGFFEKKKGLINWLTYGK